MTTAKKPRKRLPPAPAPRIVVSAHRPKITIQPRFASLRIVIPGYNLQAIVLAHAIAAQVLIEGSDECWPWVNAPRVYSGDRLMTCAIVTFDLALGDVAEIERRMVILTRHALAAVKLVVRPPGARDPSHDVVVDIAVSA